MVTRRAVLMTGAASLVVLGGGVGGLVLSKSIDSVREPWLAAGDSFGDHRLDALAYAILAPNPHNRQPWLVRLDEDDSLTLFCDLDRLLPATDPPNRQVTIGLGAFLELLRQAAAEKGFDLEVDRFPDGEPHPTLDQRPVARVTFKGSEETPKDPLFGYVLERRTVRSNFDLAKAVSSAKLEELERLAFANAPLGSAAFASTIDDERILRLKDICREAWEIEANLPDTLNESVDLTRIGAKEVSANPDGISLYGPKMETLKLLGILSRSGMATIGSAGHKATIKVYKDAISSASAFGWLSTPSNTRLDQLHAGAIWVRLNLAATKIGLAMHPLSQVLQEFKEMAELYSAFHKEVEIKEPSRAQGLFRFGYADYPGESPRWPLESRLVKA